MEARTVPLRNELLNVLDQQIEMMTRKTFSSFTNEEKSTFQSREQRIRELQQALATAGTERVVHGGVFAGLYT